MNDDTYIHQNRRHFLATETFNLINNLSPQFTRNYLSFKPDSFACWGIIRDLERAKLLENS